MTPKTPLKSAMKVPGTPARPFDNPLSPTFREEDILEKRELSTEKEQARDVVCSIVYSPSRNHLTYTLVENQGSRSDGQVRPSRCQLQLLPDHSFHAFIDFCRVQCHPSPSVPEPHALLGHQHQRLAPEARPLYGLRVPPCLYPCLRCVLSRRSQARRESRHVLYSVRYRMGKFLSVLQIECAGSNIHLSSCSA